MKLGKPAIVRSNFGPANNPTLINAALAATGAGTIVKARIYVANTSDHLKVGIFYVVAGNTLKCRSATADLGNFTVGYYELDVNLACQAGDVIGCSFLDPNAYLYYDTAGGDGYWVKESHDGCVVDDEALYTLAGTRVASLEGETAVLSVTSTRLTASYKGATMAAALEKGEDPVTKRGVAYNSTGGDPSPLVDDKVEEEGDFETGAFTEIIPGLSPEILYYARPYAYSVLDDYIYGTTLERTTSPSKQIIATLNGRTMGESASGSAWATLRAAGGGVHLLAPDDTNPDHLAVVKDSMTASRWLFRSFLYFDLAGMAPDFTKVDLHVWVYLVTGSLVDIVLVKGVQDFELPTLANWVSANSETTILGSRQMSTFSATQYEKIELTAAGVAYIKAQIAAGSYAKFCCLTEVDFNNAYSDVVHDNEIAFFLTQEPDKEPYLEFSGGGGGNLGGVLVKGNYI